MRVAKNTTSDFQSSSDNSQNRYYHSQDGYYNSQSSLETLLDISGRDFQGILTTCKTIRALKVLSKPAKEVTDNILQVGAEYIITNNN